MLVHAGSNAGGVDGPGGEETGEKLTQIIIDTKPSLLIFVLEFKNTTKA